MNDALQKLLAIIKENDGINDKARLARIVFDAFRLTKDRSVYYCVDFAIRFSSSATRAAGNTVASLSRLQKYDDRPFVVCLVTEKVNHCFLANSTFLKKISHSSQQLRENNIRGSFNISDIVQEFEGVANTPVNLGRLFAIHAGIGFEGNLARLVEATNNISPTGAKFTVRDADKKVILAAPQRAERFIASEDCAILKAELDARVDKFQSEILVAALIENVNVRGRLIEYLIAGEDEALRLELIAALKAGNKGIPKFKTDHALGDYTRVFAEYDTQTDVKTKIMILSSNPKAYNLDKMLEFLANARSVFMFYFVAVDPGKLVNTVLISMFQEKLLRATILLKHWSGRNSRGVTQFEGATINDLIGKPEFEINLDEACRFLKSVIDL
ncbi:MAG: hypothetical protein GX594_18450 [Pirellulaceae bacterium]|nr:hypothetical protein [Pirellulaceae bacterium]